MSNYLTFPNRPSMGLGTGIGMNAFVGYPSAPCCSSCANGGSCDSGLGRVDFGNVGVAALVVIGAFVLLPWALGKK